MSEDHSNKTVVVCDTQPITAEGLRTLLATAGDLEFLASLNSLEAATQLMTARPPDVVIVDKGFGMRIVLDWIHDLKMADAAPAVTVWGVSMTEAEGWRQGDCPQDRRSGEHPELLADGGFRTQLDGRLRVPRFGAPGALPALGT